MVNNTVLDEVFGALASEPRRQIIAMLRTSSPRTMTELAKPLKMSLPAAHKHIAILENAKLIKRTKIGRKQNIMLQPTALTSAEEWIQFHRTYWNSQLDSIEEYITRKNGEV